MGFGSQKNKFLSRSKDKVAKKQNISRGEIERMAPAFRECER